MAIDHIQRYGVGRGIFLDTNGDGTGSIDQNIDGSGVPVDFILAPPPGFTYYIKSITIHLADNGTLDSGQYGNNAGILTNGVDFILSTPAGEASFTAQNPIKTNGDYAAFAYDIRHLNFGTGDEHLSVQLILDDTSAPIRIIEGESLIVRIQDDLSSINAHTTRCGVIIVKV